MTHNITKKRVIAVNCDACGDEVFVGELSTIKLATFSHTISICEICVKKTTYESYKDAADILADIIKIASDKKNPEQRLRMIKKMLGE